jgi:transcriptional regulator with XRE-family HTH domain
LYVLVCFTSRRLIRQERGGVETRIRDVRAERGWTVRRLADESGVDKNTVSEAERGLRKPNPITMYKLARALGVAVRDLFPLGQAPLEGALLLEASDEDFAAMVAVADDGELAVWKTALKEHLPEGGPLPLPKPTPKGLLAMDRCVAIYREQKRRLEDEGEHLQELLAAVNA